MYASLITFAFAATSLAAAVPAMEARQSFVCLGTYGNAQCCATDVLGLADLNCVNRKATDLENECD